MTCILAEEAFVGVRDMLEQLTSAARINQSSSHQENLFSRRAMKRKRTAIAASVYVTTSEAMICPCREADRSASERIIFAIAVPYRTFADLNECGRRAGAEARRWHASVIYSSPCSGLPWTRGERLAFQCLYSWSRLGRRSEGQTEAELEEPRCRSADKRKQHHPML